MILSQRELLMALSFFTLPPPTFQLIMAHHFLKQDPPVFNNIVFHHNILSSGFHLAGDSHTHFSIYAEVSVYTRARSTPVIPYRYFSNMIFSGRRILAEDCAPQFLTFSINIHLVPRIFPVTTQGYKID